MTKLAALLRKQLQGEVTTAKDVRDYFSTDGSVFTLEPSVVIYPREVNDIRKLSNISWKLAENQDKILPITARGKGTDQAGAALGSGAMVVFPAHMNRMLELDVGKGVVTVEPGLLYKDLQSTLMTHGWILPPYPSSIDYCTIGGAVANNSAGENTIKYGSTRDYVKNLEVVLANGEVIHTKRISKAQLSKKKGLDSLEGEIYRQLDKLIDDNRKTVNQSVINVSKNSAGYNLYDIKNKDGSFDLTPLFVGSQGTLGIITKITLNTIRYKPETTLVVGYLNGVNNINKFVAQILKLEPSAVEMVDNNLLELVHKYNPNKLNGIVDAPFPELILITEFDDRNSRTQQRKAKSVQKIFRKLKQEAHIETDYNEQQKLWKIRHSAAAVVSHSEGKKKALPIIEDGVVPQDKFDEYLKGIYKIFDKYSLDKAIWGHAGNANLHMQPFLDLSSTEDRQKVFKVMNDYYKMVMDLGGSTAGEHNDGRLRAPYLRKLYGQETYSLFVETKKIFDPYNFLNPGVKIGVTQKSLLPMLRKEYSMKHLSDHMPRT